MLTFTNPRSVAEFPDWPLGGSKRGFCRFHIEHKAGKGYRVGRTTQNPKTGLMCATKYNTYGGPAAIVDGSDGKTYILQYAAPYNFVAIYRHDFMSAAESSAHPGSNPERFNELLAIIKATASNE